MGSAYRFDFPVEKLVCNSRWIQLDSLDNYIVILLGPKCEDNSTVHYLFNISFDFQFSGSKPKVFLTVVHTDPPKNIHDATSVWAEEVTSIKFKVCLRELKNFDGVHENIRVVSVETFSFLFTKSYFWAFSLTWPASSANLLEQKKAFAQKGVQLPQDWFGTPTWPPFHCFGTPIWPPWRHVKTLLFWFINMADVTSLWKRSIKNYNSYQ